jgi:hypothetical protein
MLFLVTLLVDDQSFNLYNFLNAIFIRTNKVAVIHSKYCLAYMILHIYYILFD